MTQVQTPTQDPTPNSDARACVLTIEREFDAKPQRVFDAWTRPEQLLQWWGPEGMTVPDSQLEVRVGGAWRTTMRAQDGQEFTVSGKYRTIEPPRLLEFTWAWHQDGTRGHETLVRMQLDDLGGRTRMRFQQQTFADAGARDRHNEGWTSSFRCLDQLLE